MSGDQDKADQQKTRHIDVELGRRLRDLRGAMGLTRGEVARALDVSVTRVQDYEGGDRIPASRLWQFCRHYDVAVETLFDALPHSVEGRATGVAEEGAPFSSPFGQPSPDDVPSADDMMRAISAAAEDLNPVERRLALAALRGMGTRKLKVP